MLSIVENIGKLERRVTLSVFIETVQKEVEARLRQLAKKSRMPGFRPGKVPLKIVRAQHGKQLETEVLGEHCHQAFSEFSRAQNLKVIGQLRFSSKEDKSDERNYAFDATFEVYPEIEIHLDKLSEHPISHPATTIGDPEIDRTLEVLRRQKVRYTERSAEHRADNIDACAAQLDDRVTLDIEGTIEDKAFSGGSAKDWVVVLGQDPLPPEFETTVLGLKSGETRVFEMKFPVDHPDAKLAHKTAQFTLTLKKIEQPHYPDINADFAVSLGIAGGDLVRMRTEIKENLEREAQRRIQLLLQRQVMDSLLTCATLEVPRSLIERDQQRLAEIAHQDMKKSDPFRHHRPISAEIFKEQAERRVKLGLICTELIQKYDLQAKPEQVRKAVEIRSKSYQEPSEIVRWYYADTQRLTEIEAEVVENNIIDFVLSRAKVENQSLGFEALANASR